MRPKPAPATKIVKNPIASCREGAGYGDLYLNEHPAPLLDVVFLKARNVLFDRFSKHTRAELVAVNNNGVAAQVKKSLFRGIME